MVSYRKELAGFMARKSLIEREKKREMLIEYADKRQALLEQFENATQREKLELHRQIQQLPCNSAPNRQRKRCWVTGRPGVYTLAFLVTLRENHQGLYREWSSPAGSSIIVHSSDQF